MTDSLNAQATTEFISADPDPDNAAGRVLAFDPDLARDLSDLANDYAGPYTPEETK